MSGQPAASRTPGAAGSEAEREVAFVQYDVPALQAGTYTVSVEQTVNQPGRNRFPARRTFAVAGRRFTLDPASVAGVFPPDLANGEYDGALPHVVLTAPTLPWERSSVEGDDAAPWLAVLLLDDDELPELFAATAADLVRAGQPITVEGSTATGVGRLPSGTLSYPGLERLDYGERPDQELTAVDLPVDLFSRVAPSAGDLHWLAHVRHGDTTDVEDTPQARHDRAIVLGNRVARSDATAHALLVSLERMGPWLPGDDGTPSSGLAGFRAVRLTVLRSWSFTANDLDETFLELLAQLNSPPEDRTRRISALRLPYVGGTEPRADAVAAAMAAQAAGTLTADQGRVLLDNAIAMGYVPLAEHLRFGGETLAWYRGPLAPFDVEIELQVPISCPDAANRYDPQTGVFDVSYGAAWQLGQLLALASSEYAVALYNWRRELRRAEAVAEEQALIDELLGDALPSVTARRERRLPAAEETSRPPRVVVDWLASLSLLGGVPFNYLVPDERMLPPESLRLFHLDRAWMAALLDGAFSIGRATTGEQRLDLLHAEPVHALVAEAARALRPNPRPAALRAAGGGPLGSRAERTTGFLLRSQVVSGWPQLGVVGYEDADMTREVAKLRMVRLSGDVLLCLFDGAVGAVAIHEPPEQLHCGVEGRPGAFTTTLRAVSGTTPGRQLRDPETGGWATTPVRARADERTVRVAGTAASLAEVLRSRFGQQFRSFTSAELALELVKGVVRVEFADV